MHVTSRRWTDRTAAATTVKVYGTADTVRLRVNGAQVGPPKTSTNHIFSWPLTLAKGTNKIEAIGTRDGTEYIDTATWTLR